MMTMETTRRKERRKQMEARVKSSETPTGLPLTNRKMGNRLRNSLRRLQHQVNKVAHKIMMKGKKSQKVTNKIKSQRIDMNNFVRKGISIGNYFIKGATMPLSLFISINII